MFSSVNNNFVSALNNCDVAAAEKFAPSVEELNEETGPITTQTKMAAFIDAYIGEAEEDPELDNLFLHCFIRTTPNAPLPLRRRLAVLRLLTLEVTEIQKVALREIGARAKGGLWRKGADEELGQAIFLVDLRSVFQDKFPNFLKVNGEVLGTTLERYYPHYPNDHVLQVQVHAETMDLVSSDDWKQLSAIVSSTSGFTEQIFNILANLEVRMMNDGDEEQIFEVGGCDFKQALFSIIAKDLAYFLKSPNAKERSALVAIFHRLDLASQLSPQEIIAITRIFGAERNRTAILYELYLNLLSPFLIRHSLPLQALGYGIQLLQTQSFSDLVLFRDFPKVFPFLQPDFTHEGEAHIRACLLWPELQIPLPANLNSRLELALIGCKNIHHPINFLSLLNLATQPENGPLLRKRIPDLIQYTEGFIDLERTLMKEWCWKKQCEGSIEILAVAEALLKVLSAVSPEEHSEEISTQFAQFISKIHPMLAGSDNRFFDSLIDLANKAPSLFSGLTIHVLPQEPETV